MALHWGKVLKFLLDVWKDAVEFLWVSPEIPLFWRITLGWRFIGVLWGFLVDCMGFCCPIAELCEAEYEQGPCRASIKRWYYNKETGICQTFYYGGCQGNKNNYMNEDKCKSTCTGEVPGLVLPRDSRLQHQDWN